MKILGCDTYQRTRRSCLVPSTGPARCVDLVYPLCHYRLLHLQVCLLQAKEDLAFLQRLVEVSELFGPRARDVRLGEEVMLDSLSLNVIDVTFPEHLSKGTLKGR
jgi:hypothetical protein